MSKKHPYFYPIRKGRLLPMQAIWDNVREGEKFSTYWPRFKRSLTLSGELALPQERQVRAWSRDVLAGLIPRPSAVGEQEPDLTPKEEPAAAPAEAAPVAQEVEATVIEPGGVLEALGVGVPVGNEEQASITPPDDVADYIVAAEISFEDLKAAVKSVSETVPHGRIEVINTPLINADNEADEVFDPVEYSVNAIIKHYQDQEFALARQVAAKKAAEALRYFAAKIEAAA